MAQDILREFLVALGFKVDEAGFHRFSASVNEATKAVAGLAAGVAAAAVATGAAVLSIAKQFDQLYYVSQRTNSSAANIRAFAFAIGQMGGTAEGAVSSLEAFARNIRQMPGYENLIKYLGIATRDSAGHLRDYTEVLQDVGTALAKVPYSTAAKYFERLGIDENTGRALIAGIGKFSDEYKAKLKASGLNPDVVAQQGRDLTREWNSLSASVGIVIDRFVGKLLEPAGPGKKNILEQLQDFLDKHGDEIAAGMVSLAQAISQLVQSIGDLVADPKFYNFLQGIADVLNKIAGIQNSMGSSGGLLGWLFGGSKAGSAAAPAEPGPSDKIPGRYDWPDARDEMHYRMAAPGRGGAAGAVPGATSVEALRKTLDHAQTQFLPGLLEVFKTLSRYLFGTDNPSSTASISGGLFGTLLQVMLHLGLASGLQFSAAGVPSGALGGAGGGSGGGGGGGGDAGPADDGGGSAGGGFMGGVKRILRKVPGVRGLVGAKTGAGGGATPSAKVIDYSAGELANAVGGTPGDVTSFRQVMSGIESHGRYGIMGGSSNRFAGAYQMGAAEIRDTAKSLGVPVPSRNQFLHDPALQERFFERYTLQHHKILMNDPRYANASAQEKLAILGYAHNQGAGGALKWLRTGHAGHDAFGTSGEAYTNALRKRFAFDRAHPTTIKPLPAHAPNFGNIQHGQHPFGAPPLGYNPGHGGNSHSLTQSTTLNVSGVSDPQRAAELVGANQGKINARLLRDMQGATQ